MILAFLLHRGIAFLLLQLGHGGKLVISQRAHFVMIIHAYFTQVATTVMTKAESCIPIITTPTFDSQIKDLLKIFQVLHNEIIRQAVNSPVG